MEKLYLIAIIGLALFIPTYVFAVDPSATITMIPAQTTNPWVIKNSAGTTVFSVSPNGTVTGVLKSINGNLTISKSGFPNTEIDAGSGVETASYVIGKLGSTYYAKNGTSGAITFSGSNFANVVNNALNTMSHGGKVLIKPGDYPVNPTINIPDTTAYSFIFSGEGQTNTKLYWTGSSGGYAINAFVKNTRIQLQLQNISVWGGSGVGNETGRSINIGRLNSGQTAVYLFQDVRFSKCIDVCVNATFIQQGTFINVYEDQNLGWDLALTNSSHLDISYSQIEKIRDNASHMNYFGGESKSMWIDQIKAYETTIIGTYFDPVQTGFQSNLMIGNKTLVQNVMIENDVFCNTVENATKDYHINLGLTANVELINNHFCIASPDPNIYIRVGSGSISTLLDLENGTLSSKVLITGNHVMEKNGQLFANKIPFNASSLTAGLNIGICNTCDPASTVTGDIWFNSGSGAIRLHDNTGNIKTIMSLTGGGTVTNKVFDSSNFISDSSDTSKRIGFSLSGATASTTLTIEQNQTTSQKLQIPNLIATDIVDTLGTNQTITGQKTYTATSSLPGLTVGTLAGTPSTCKVGSLMFNSAGLTLDVCSATTPTWRPIVTTTQSLTISGSDTFSGANTFSNNQTISTGQNLYMGTANITTSAVRGYLYLSTTDGVPTGTPASHTGGTPVTYDGKENKLCVYNSGWKCVILS